MKSKYSMIQKNSAIFVTGHNGLVGSSVVRRLKISGFKKIITRTRKQLDLRNQKKVELFFKKNVLFHQKRAPWSPLGAPELLATQTEHLGTKKSSDKS